MVLGRLKPGVPARDAARDLRAIGEELAHEFPDSNRGFFFTPVPIADDLVADRGLLLEELGGAVTLFLLIACTNVASLLLARSLSRRREFAVRRALGATTGREIRSAVAESLALTVPAAGLGILLSSAARAFLVLLLPDGIASAVPGAAPGASEAAAALAVSLAVAVVLGLLTTVRQPGGEMILSSGRSPGGDRRGQRALRALVVGEMAIALVLLCAAATLVENFIRLQRADLGFQSARLLTATVAVPPGRPFGPGEKSRLEKDLTRRIEGLPGVASVTAGDHVPLMVSNSSAAFAIDRRIADPGEQLVANYREIATGYFETLAIPVLRGRSFDARDHADAQPVCIVSRSMARRFFPRGDAIGKRLRRTRADEPAPWRTIVGIVDDVREPRLAGGIREALYVPADQSVTRDSSWDFRQVLLAIRTASPGAAAASVRAAIDRYDPTHVRPPEDELVAASFLCGLQPDSRLVGHVLRPVLRSRPKPIRNRYPGGARRLAAPDASGTAGARGTSRGGRSRSRCGDLHGALPVPFADRQRCAELRGATNGRHGADSRGRGSARVLSARAASGPNRSG